MKLKFFTQAEWAEVKRYPHADWQYDVSEGNTRLGYMNWVVGQCEADGINYTLDNEADLDDTSYPRAEMEGDDYDDWCYEVENLDTRQGLDAWVFERRANIALDEANDLDVNTAPAVRLSIPGMRM